MCYLNFSSNKNLKNLLISPSKQLLDLMLHLNLKNVIYLRFAIAK